MTTSAIAQMLQFQIHCFEQFLGAMAPGFQCLSSYMKLRRKINEMEHSFNIVSWSSGPTNNIFCFVYFSVSLVDFPDIDLTPYVMQWVTQTPIWKGWNALFVHSLSKLRKGHFGPEGTQLNHVGVKYFLCASLCSIREQPLAKAEISLSACLFLEIGVQASVTTYCNFMGSLSTAQQCQITS